MSTATLEPIVSTPSRSVAIGPDSAGVRMTPAEFDAIEDYDESCRYELIDGVLVVNPIPGDAQADPNELLGNLLYVFKTTHPNGRLLDKTRPERYIRVQNGRRLADRVLWIGLGRRPNSKTDTPTVAVEFVSRGRRNQHRDYVLKREEYMQAGVHHYWIFDRFARALTVHRQTHGGVVTEVYREQDVFRPDVLPGFELPVSRILAEADAAAAADGDA
jgi:Uma2 family endonuclease